MSLRSRVARRLAGVAFRLDPVAAARGNRANGASTAGREWGPAWAKNLSVGDLIAVHGEQLCRPELGLRALRVSGVEQAAQVYSLFGHQHAVIAVLVQDVDSGEPHSLELPPHQPLRLSVMADDAEIAALGGES
jgi:hypothetical protein